MSKYIFYWAPFFSNIATSMAVINSAISLKKFSKNHYEPVIIDVFGEWQDHLELINKHHIKIEKLNLDSHFSDKKINGFFKSRLFQIKIFLFAFIPLLNLLKKKKTDVFVSHLVTSLPLFLNFIFTLKTEMILRISGLPKLNIFRKIFWKIVLKKISVITTPTISTQSFIKNKIKNKPIFLLRDPILNIGNIKKNKLNKNIINNKFLAMGRLTKQKNFLFLLKCFQLIIKKNPKINLFILGEGEEFHRLKNFIKTNNLEKNIFLEGYKKNIYDYLLDSKAFILSSLWEDPGFVLIEAAYSNTTIISSDCNNGPKEILNNGKNGFIFNSNDKKNFLEVFNNFQLSSRREIYEKKLNAKKMSRKFTLFNHYLEIQKILSSYEK